MALREGSAAAGQSCLLTVEKRLERDQRRQQKIGERAYQRSKKQNAMFDVINRVMGTAEGEWISAVQQAAAWAIPGEKFSVQLPSMS